jgi:hypothetical protein
MTWASWLLSLVGPIAVRLLGFLGIAVATFAGVDVAFSTLQTWATSNYSGLPVAVLQLAGLSGIPQALGMIFGAFNARLTLWTWTAAKQFIFK